MKKVILLLLIILLLFIFYLKKKIRKQENFTQYVNDIYGLRGRISSKISEDCPVNAKSIDLGNGVYKTICYTTGEDYEEKYFYNYLVKVLLIQLKQL